MRHVSDGAGAVIGRSATLEIPGAIGIVEVK